MFVRPAARILAALFVALALPSQAQVTTYHFHNEASATASTKQLRVTGPDVAQTVAQTAALQGAAPGRS